MGQQNYQFFFKLSELVKEIANKDVLELWWVALLSPKKLFL